MHNILHQNTSKFYFYIVAKLVITSQTQFCVITFNFLLMNLNHKKLKALLLTLLTYTKNIFTTYQQHYTTFHQWHFSKMVFPHLLVPTYPTILFECHARGINSLLNSFLNSLFCLNLLCHAISLTWIIVSESSSSKLLSSRLILPLFTLRIAISLRENVA